MQQAYYVYVDIYLYILLSIYIYILSSSQR